MLLYTHTHTPVQALRFWLLCLCSVHCEYTLNEALPNMKGLVYTTPYLLKFKNIDNHVLPEETVSKITALGIKKKYRGTRGGRR